MTKFVRVRFDLHCEWRGFPPEYRIYVNDELFTERTFRVNAPSYYKELLQVKGNPGKYTVKLEPVPPHADNFKMKNLLIEYGDGVVLNETEFEII